MKTWIFIGIALGALIAGTPTTNAVASGPAKELIWGVGAPLSGPIAAVGIAYGREYQLAAESIGEFTVAGQRYKWKVIVEDNKYTSDGGVSSTQALMVKSGARVVSQVGGAPGLAAQPLIEGAKNVLYDAVVSSPAILGPASPHTFRLYPGADSLLPVLMGWIKKNRPDIKTASIVYANDATGPTFQGGLKAGATYYGIKLLKEQKYQSGTTDFYPVLQNVLPDKPDFLFVWGSAGAIIKAARELGYKGTFAVPDLFPGDVTVAGAANMEGILYLGTAFPSPLNPQVWNDFAAQYTAKYKQVASSAIILPYMSMYLFTGAMQAAGSVDNVDRIADVLRTQAIQTPVGPITCGGRVRYGINNQAMLPAFISTLKGGQGSAVARIEAPDVAKVFAQVWAGR